jgi:phospholipid N-methyltransferase
MPWMNPRRSEASTPLLESVADAAYFFRRFLSNPKRVASVIPSSRFLAAAMFAGLPLEDGHVLIEFGPGSGAFTREVVRLRRAGLKLVYLGIERDAGLYRRLCSRYPDFDFQLGDVRDVAKFVAERRLPKARAVISGLPLVLMPEHVQDRIFEGVATVLETDGVFRTFSYVNNYPTAAAIRLRKRFERSFDNWTLSRPVIRNLPPAFVLTGVRPVRGVAGSA